MKKAKSRIEEIRERLAVLEQLENAENKIPSNWEDFARRCQIRSGGKLVSFQPYNYQIALSKLIKQYKEIDLVKVRQVGNTEFWGNICPYYAARNPAYSGAIFSLSGDFAGEVSFRCQEMIKAFGLETVNDNVRLVRLVGGGSIHFRNSSEKGSRSLPSIQHIIIDEASHQPKGQEIIAASTPSTDAVEDSCIITASTLWSITDWWWFRLESYGIDVQEMLAQVRDGKLYTGEPGFYVYPKGRRALVVVHWRCVPRHRSIERTYEGGYIQKVRDDHPDLSEETIQREYNLTPSMYGSTFLPGELINRAIATIPDTAPSRFFVGIDPNFGGSDFCCGVLLGYYPNGQLFVLDWYYQNHRPTLENIHHLINLLSKYGPTRSTVEVNGGGRNYYESFKKAFPKLEIIPFTNNHQRKKEGANALAVLLEKERLKYPDGCPLIQELRNLETHNGTIMARAGHHDDFVMAVIAALYGINYRKQGLDLSRFDTYGRR